MQRLDFLWPAKAYHHNNDNKKAFFVCKSKTFTAIMVTEKMLYAQTNWDIDGACVVFEKYQVLRQLQPIVGDFDVRVNIHNNE